MVKRFWRWLVRLIQPILPPCLKWRRHQRVKLQRLSDADYQRLFEQLLTGVSQGWNPEQVSQHLGHRINDRYFRAWLLEYGKQLRQLPEVDHRLACKLLQLSRLGCGELGEIAADIGRDLLAKLTVKREEDEVKNENAETDEPAVGLNRGNQPLTGKDFISAITPFDQTIELKSDNHKAWQNRGDALMKSGKHEQALVSFDQAIELKPDNHELWQNRGNVLAKLGEYEKALVSFDKAIELKPDNHEAWQNRGDALVKLGENEKALVSFDKAIELKPNNHELWQNRGNVLAKSGKYEQALVSFDQAIEIKPDDHKYWYNQGNAWAKLGEYEKAIANYDQAIQIKPDFYQAWTNRGNALADLGEKQEAIANYDQAIQIKSDFHDAWNNRGVALAELREYEKAIANYDQAIQIKSDFHDAWHNRGVALFRLGEYEQAIANYHQAIQIKPDLHASWINRGIVLVNSWNYNPEAAAVVPLQIPNVSPIVSNPIETQCGYQGELLSYQQGLNYCPQNTHPEGWGRLHQAIGNAHYHEGKYQPNYQNYWQKAVTEYHQSLITLTPDTYPEWHLEVLQNLIRILLGLNQDTAAQEWPNRGLTVFQTLLHKKSPFQKRKLMAKFIRFSQMRVDV